MKVQVVIKKSFPKENTFTRGRKYFFLNVGISA